MGSPINSWRRARKIFRFGQVWFGNVTFLASPQWRDVWGSDRSADFTPLKGKGECGGLARLGVVCVVQVHFRHFFQFYKINLVNLNLVKIYKTFIKYKEKFKTEEKRFDRYIDRQTD